MVFLLPIFHPVVVVRGPVLEQVGVPILRLQGVRLLVVLLLDILLLVVLLGTLLLQGILLLGTLFRVCHLGEGE